jgi:hypothetical protein
MESQSGRRLFPYPWESCQGFYQVINGLGISSHWQDLNAKWKLQS